MTALTVGSLFSGIGGIDLGLERAGFTVAWQAESDAFCRGVLSRHWPDTPCYEDVRHIDGAAPRVDLLAGGFPCQPVSVAGLRRGQHDERWLWPEFARIIGDLRPRYVFVENVPGLISSRAIGDVLGSLSSMGYDAEWQVVSAAALGAPHLRERLALVAYSDSVGLSRGSRLFGEAGRRELEDAGGEWSAEPHVDRVAHGLPHRMDRVKALGNAVVPQWAEWVGRQIISYDSP